MLSKEQLRKKFIQCRKALSSTQAQQESEGLVAALIQTPEYQQAKEIAVYLATPQEISLHPIIQACWLNNKKTYLPCLNDSTLIFTKFQENTPLIKNQFNIPEPEQNTTTIAPLALDLVLMPLIAIDQHGNRLGMGKGFYDKTFYFLNHNPRPPKPLLIGVGFQCQSSIASLPSNTLDIPCNAMLTHKQFYRCI